MSYNYRYSYGAAKTLSTFASKYEECSVRNDVQEAITDFVEAKKPIGMCCIAPVIAARILPGAEITLGNNKDVERTVTLMGAKHIQKQADEIHVDFKNRLVTTPAYMLEVPCHEVFDGTGWFIHRSVHTNCLFNAQGIGKMVQEVLRLASTNHA